MDKNKSQREDRAIEALLASLLNQRKLGVEHVEEEIPDVLDDADKRAIRDRKERILNKIKNPDTNDCQRTTLVDIKTQEHADIYAVMNRKGDDDNIDKETVDEINKKRADTIEKLRKEKDGLG